MLVSFVLCVLTSIVLYIVPHGRVAYWTDWHLWGLSRTEWANQHVNLGFLLLVAGLLHIYYNWNPILAYMKNRAREIRVLTPSFNVAFLITLVIGLGTYFQIPPMSIVIDLSESIKEAASVKYGEPPYGHAEMSSLKMFTKRTSLDLEKAKTLLAAKGIVFKTEKQSVSEIAKENLITPKQVYETIKPAIVVDNAAVFPDSPSPGFGRKTLAEVCSEYHLEVNEIIMRLAGKQISATAGQTVKEIAAGVDIDPHAFFEVLHDVVKEK